MLAWLAWIGLAVALGADRPTLAVVGLHEPGRSREDQERLVRVMERTVRDAGRVTVLDPVDLKERVRGLETVIVEDGLLSSAIANLNTGKGLVNQAAPDAALLSLETSVGEFLRALPAADAVDDLWEAWVYIGMCRLAISGSTEASAVAFQNAVALAPQRPLDAALFPPHVVEAYESERRFLSTFPMELQVTTDGPATVWVDGVERGRAPLRVDGLVPGEHYVVARGRGTQGYSIVPAAIPPRQGGVEIVRPVTQERVRIAMRLPPRGQAADSVMARRQQAAALYEAIGRRARDVDYLLLAGVESGRLLLQLHDARRGLFSSAVEVPVGDDVEEALRPALTNLVAMIDEEGRLRSTAGAAVPLLVSANPLLAELLVKPSLEALPGPAVADAGRRGQERRGRGWVGVGVGVLGAAIAGGTVYALGGFDALAPSQGQVRIAF